MLRDAAIQAEYESGRHEETESKAKAHIAILARDVAWADRLLAHVHDRIPTDDDGGITRSAMLTMILSGAAGILFSLWWFLVR
jgi:hypothetical protein